MKKWGVVLAGMFLYFGIAGVVGGASDGDFFVQRGETVIANGNTTATITEGVDYTLAAGASATNTIIRITNTRQTGMGDTAGGGTQNLDDFTVRIDNPGNVLTSINFVRAGTVNPQRVAWEVIQYNGRPGGPNEILVRDVDSLSTTGTTINGSTITTISTSSRVAIIITSQSTDNTGAGIWGTAQFTAALTPVVADFRADLTRGVTNNTGFASFAVIEFTGSNWRDVTRDEFTSAAHNATLWTIAASGNSGTQAIGTALLDASKAFLHTQYRNSNGGNQGLDDAGENIELTSSLTNYTTRRRTATGAANKTHVVWVIENTQSDAGAMSVEHIANYEGDVTGPEEKVYTISVTQVDDVDQTSIWGENSSSDGAGNAYPRGSANVFLNMDDEVSWTVSDTGQEERRTFSVVQWPFEITTPFTEQTRYRWRDDSTALNTSGGFLAAEDGALNDMEKNTIYRLRMQVVNEGIAIEDAGRQYELQWGDRQGVGSCGAISTWTGVANATDEFQMIDATNITSDGQSVTSGLLTVPSGGSFVNGEGRDSADTTGTIGPLAVNEYTELEYSIEAGPDAVPANTYCFRLYDQLNNEELDTYDVYPQAVIAATTTVQTNSTVGEAGTFTSVANGGWTTVAFTNTYADPVVVGTTNTRAGNDAVVFESRNVTATSADMRLCESDGQTADGCATHAAETVGYMIIDAAVASVMEGIEAGTFDIDTNYDLNRETVSYVEAFGTAPEVFGAVQTVDGTSPIEFRVQTTSVSGFEAGICEPDNGSSDACETTHGTETVGWIAVEPGNIPFAEEALVGQVSALGGGAWSGITFTPNFTSTPVVVTEVQTQLGTQDHHIDEARLVTTIGADIRFCEIDGPNTCDSHNNEDLAWIAVEDATLTGTSTFILDQSSYRWYLNTDAITPVTAAEAENTATTSVLTGDQLRLRLGILSGINGLPTTTLGLRMQYGTSTAITACDAITSWSDVGESTSTEIWRTVDNPSVANGTTLPSSLLNGSGNTVESYTEFPGFVFNPNAIPSAGRGEWDIALENNGAATSTAYCFRGVTASGGVLQYSNYPAVMTNSLPVASSVSIDGGAGSVILTESTTTTVSCVGTVTDANGFEDITSVTADFFRTGVGIGAPLDANDHYQLIGDTECVPSGGSGTSETYTCDFAVEYYADPTDVGSPNAADDWTCTMTPNDGTGVGTSSSDTIEVNSLLALSITNDPVSYGTHAPGDDTGTLSESLTVENTGNRDMDPQISGTNMTSGADSIAVGEQEYDDTAVAYGLGNVLTTTPTTLNLTLPQRTGVIVTDDVFWGIGIPSGTSQGVYTGTAVLTASIGL